MSKLCFSLRVFKSSFFCAWVNSKLEKNVSYRTGHYWILKLSMNIYQGYIRATHYPYS